MARKRMIDPSIWEDEDVGALSSTAFKVFIACISNADDEGRLPGSARQLRAIAFRYDDSVSVEATEGALQELDARLRSFVRYEVEGRVYIALLKWDEYQRISHPYPSKIPQPPENPIPFTERSVNVPGTLHASIDKYSIGTGTEENSCRTSDGNALHSVTEKPPKPEPDPRIASVFDHYKTRIQPKARLCPDRKITARLKTFSVEELKAGIDHFSEDEWWMENNANRGAEWFFRSDSHVEQFLNMAPRKGNGNGTDPDKPNPFAKYARGVRGLQG